MENYKIKNFEKENPTKEFPDFNTLPGDKAQEIFSELSERIEKNAPPDHLVKIINQLGAAVKDVKANNDGFDLARVLSELNIRPNENVYINWYRFDNIDEMHFVDLNSYFDEIWYPGSDDIDIFDSTLSWLLSISHDGNIKYLILKKDPRFKS